MRGVLTYVSCVVSGAKDEFGCSVVAGANVGNVGFSSNQMFGATEVTELENASLWVE